MSDAVTPPTVPTSGRFRQVIGAILIALSLLVLLGWLFQVDLLKSLLPGLSPMKINSAICFGLCGIALILYANPQGGAWAKSLRLLLAAIVAAVGLITLFEYLFEWNSGLDDLFYSSSALITPGEPFPGRMPTFSALGFLLAGVSFILLELHKTAFAQAVAIVMGFLGMLNLIGYLYNVPNITGLSLYTRTALQALNTSVGFILLSAGLLQLHPTSGLLAVAQGSLASNVIRRLLPATIFVPIVLGWLLITGERLDLYDAGLGLAFFAIASMIVFSGLTWWNAVALNASEAQRKRSERLLVENEEGFRLIFTSYPLPMWVFDKETLQFLEVNEAAVAHYGYSKEEFLNMRITDLRFAEDIPALLDYLAKQQPYIDVSSGWRHRKKSGEEIVVQITTHGMEYNRRPAMLVVSEDITNRAKAERALQESERRYRTIVESAWEGIITSNEDGIITYVNERVALMLGYNVNEILGHRIFDFLPEETRKLIRTRRPEYRPGTTERHEVRFVRKDGSDLWVISIFSPTFTPEGKFTGGLSMLFDLTDRKTMETELRESEERYRTIIETSQEGIWVASPEPKILYVNQRMADMLGYSVDEILNQNPFKFVAPEYHSLNERNMELRRQGKSDQYDIRFVRKDGSDLWLIAAITPQLNRQGELVSLLAMFTDITERKRIEKELSDSERRYRTIVETSQEGILISDKDGIITYTNQQLASMIGYTVEEMVGRAGVDFADEPTRALILSNRPRYRPGVPVRFDGKFIRKDGSFIWMIATTSPLFNADGEPTGGLTVLMDITERKRGEEVLRASESRYRGLIENSADAIALFGADGTILYGSPSTTRILGYTLDEFEGRSAFELIHTDDQPFVVAHLTESLEKPGEGISVHARVLHKDGSWRWLEGIFTNLLDEPGIRAIVNNYHDNTEQKRAEDELRASERRFRTLLDTAQEGIWLMDNQGKIVYINQCATDMLGYTAEELLGTDGINLLDEQDRERANKLSEERRSGSSMQFDWHFTRKDGSDLWTIMAVSPQYNLNNEYQGLLVLVTDITERKQAEDARLAREAAEEASRAKSEFLSRMSHELRTPLNSILGFAQLLQLEELRSSQQESVEYILKAGEHLLNLINEVLEIARIEAGRLSLSPEPVLLDTLLAESIQLIKLAALGRSIDIRFNGGKDIYVVADQQRIKQVVLNLLSNAVKYNRIGGTITVSYERRATKKVCIKVSDTGFGIPPDQLPKLFSPFERLGAGKTDIEGTGLGLTLSKHLIEAMGGTMGVESELGRGSTFWVELAEAEMPGKQASNAALQAITKTGPIDHALTVLYIEDNLANLTLVERIMARWPQFQLIPAMKGRLGIELAYQHHPDLILLDLHLPDMQGDEALRELKANPQTADIPIVMVSADASQGQIDRLMSTGAYAYITKPLNVAEFVRMIQDISQQKG